MQQVGRGRQTLTTLRTGPSRRSVLSGIGGVIATGALSRVARALPPQGISPTMAVLSAYMANASDRALPDEVMEKTKQHVLDTLAAMISGSQLPPGAAALKFTKTYRGEATSTVVVSRINCGAVDAAFTNAMLAHSDETDDSHSPSLSHPGCAVVPAALATGEQFGVDGLHFLRAVALGYDIGPRVSMTLGGIKFQTETHKSSHAIAGAFGAAAAAGCCSSLNEKQARWLLDYTAQQASGIAAWQRDSEHIEKAFVFAGMPARSGVTSALLVHSGWTGVDDIFSGPDNFLIAFAPNANPAGLVEHLGERYEVTRTNIKKWSVGSAARCDADPDETATSPSRSGPEHRRASGYPGGPGGRQS
jgi:2-methylcitrate dehydratase PrpD